MTNKVRRIKKIIDLSSEDLNDTNNQIFNYIKPYNNDMLSEMNGIDLQDLLYYIDNYYLVLKKRLGFNDYITFGLELEFENTKKNNIVNYLNNCNLANTWIIKNDNSLKEGAEINSPVLKDTVTSWKNLDQVCKIVNRNSEIGENSGGHIHIGTQVIGNKRESWLNFIKLWSVYENIIYRFAYGDFLVGRTSIKKFAEPMAKDFWIDYSCLKLGNYSTEEIIGKINHKKYQAVTFVNVSNLSNYKIGNTIEFRCPNGSDDAVIWQNNVNFFVNMLLYSKDSKFNDDIVTKRYELNKDKYRTLSDYNELYLQQALELCDMIFNNNFDKIYFLRQYLKSFQIGNEEFKKTNEFTMKLKK